MTAWSMHIVLERVPVTSQQSLDQPVGLRHSPDQLVQPLLRLDQRKQSLPCKA